MKGFSKKKLYVSFDRTYICIRRTKTCKDQIKQFEKVVCTTRHEGHFEVTKLTCHASSRLLIDLSSISCKGSIFCINNIVG